MLAKVGYARNRSRTACFNEGFLKQAILGSKRLAGKQVDMQRSLGRVGKLMGLPKVGKLVGNAVSERSARVLLRTMIVSFPALFLHKYDK